MRDTIFGMEGEEKEKRRPKRGEGEREETEKEEGQWGWRNRKWEEVINSSPIDIFPQQGSTT